MRVRILNGTGTPGEASDAATSLRGAGFAIAGTGDAGQLGVAQTEVLHPPGAEAGADLVARWLTGEADLVEDETVDDITVVTGTDWQGVRTRPLPAPEPEEQTTTTLQRVPDVDGPDGDDTTTTTVLGTVSGAVPDDVVCG